MAINGLSPAFVAVLAAASISHAGDFCFNSTSPPNPASYEDPDVLVIAQKFRLPTKGKCREIVGWEVGTTNQADGRPVSGTACLNSSETTLRVGIVIHGMGAFYLPSEPIHVRMDLPYPSLIGGAVHLHRQAEHASYFLDVLRFDGVAGPCGFAGFPIP